MIIESGINPDLELALKKLSIKEFTPIQAQAIPAILKGNNVVMESATGSGKTLAYLLPLFTTIDGTLPTAQAIVLVPTHELALQVNEVAKHLAKYSGINVKSAIIMGNVNITRQIDQLKTKPQLIIGTPGRIHELIKKRKIAAHTVKTIVIDEADKMLDKLNEENVKAVIKTTLKDRRFIFASASIPKETLVSAKAICEDFEHINAKSSEIPKNIEHLYITVEKRDKVDTLRKLIYALKPKRAIVFTNQSENIQAVHEKLVFQKFNISCLYGAMQKADRAKQIQAFKSGKNNILLASDVAGRGLHFEQVDYVIHLNIAESPKDYIHRAGRCGRNGYKGVSICIATERELSFLKTYERKLKIKIAKRELEKGKLVDPSLNQKK